MTAGAPDLPQVLNKVASLARHAARRAQYSPGLPVREAGAVMEVLTGTRLPAGLSAEIGPERACTVHMAKSILILSSMLATRAGFLIDIAGVLDDLRPPGAPGDGPAQRPCLRCGRPFRSAWCGHRVCDDCTPRQVDEPYEP